MLRPVGNFVLVRVLVGPATSDGAHGAPVYVPDSSRELSEEGEIVGVGRGFVHEEAGLIPIEDVVTGDRVLYVKRSGKDLAIDLDGEGEKVHCRLLKYEDVLAVAE